MTLPIKAGKLSFSMDVSIMSTQAFDKGTMTIEGTNGDDKIFCLKASLKESSVIV